VDCHGAIPRKKTTTVRKREEGGWEGKVTRGILPLSNPRGLIRGRLGKPERRIEIRPNCIGAQQRGINEYRL